ncbi:MAG TPA: nitrogen fixation protein NifH [Dehalococcoidia bacterium]|nr:nitrogen fixation protein NifH [Dehalococcoidia bacterium]
MMASWKDKLNGDPIPWLLENDLRQPGVRYFTLRDIIGQDETDSEVKAAKAAIMTSGPVPVILEGDWDKPGYSFRPKYRRTEYTLINIAQLGADGADPRIRASCEIILSQYIDNNGGLSFSRIPSDFSNCTAGIMGAALIDLGWLDDRRLQRAMEWLAQTITGERVTDAPDRDTSKGDYKSGNSSPLFACSNHNANLPCAWGAIKALIALSKVPAAQRTSNMHEAIKLGVELLLSRDPAVADYPFGFGNKPSSRWFTFFFPLGTSADVLQNLEILAALGQAENPKLANALDLVISKQNQQGRWKLEYTYVGIQEKKGQPSKWITLRALRVLKAAYPETE